MLSSDVYSCFTSDTTVKKLRENGVIIVDQIETFDYGKFVHIMDPEGNKIELGEPINS